MSIPGPGPSLVSQLGADPPVVIRRVLPNGLTLLIQEDWSHPLVAFHATVQTGSALEGSFLGTGISHLVEHLLFKGTSRRSVGQIEREARSYGGTTQGFTTYDATSYQVVVNKEFWSQAADLLVDALFHPSMDKEEFTKERQVVIREMMLRKDDPGHVAWDLLMENAYRVHPYRLPIIGYEPLVARLTRQDALDYHQARYLPNAMVIAVVGSVQAQDVIRRMEELTADLQPGRMPVPYLPEEPLPVAPREVTEEAEIALSSVAIGFPSVALNSPDLYSLDLLAWILGGARGSRLERRLKEAGIVHSVSASNYTPVHRGLFIVSMRMDPQNVSQAVQGAFQEIAKTREEFLKPPEVEQAKKAFLREYLAGRQTVGGQAADLATYEVLVGDPTFALRYIQGIQRITPEDIKRVAIEYLKAERAATVRLYPLGTAPLRKETPSGLTPEGRPFDPSAGMGAGPAQGRPVARKMVLGNGIRVILQEDHRLGLATFLVSLLGGVRYETQETNGISSVTSRMLLRGTRRRSALEISDLVKAMGGELTPFSGRNSLGLTLEVVRSEIPGAAELLGELLLQPEFPSEELQKEKSLALAEIKAKEEDPFSWGMKRLAATLFTVHPYRLDPSGDPEAVARLRREDIVEFYAKIQDPVKIVVSVVGDFQSGELLKLLEDSLGKIPPRGVSPVSFPQEPPLGSLREHEELTPRKEGIVMIGFPGLSVTDPRVPSLDLIETVLSGGAGRLFAEVRDRRGLAYTVGAFSLHGVDPGAFVLYAVAEPSQLDPVRQALLEEIRRLRSGPIPEEEFRQAQQGLLGSRRVARQTQATLASQGALDELYGLGWDFAQRYDEKVKEATPEELHQVARALLDPQRCVVVIGQKKEEEPGLLPPKEKQASEAIPGRP